MSAERPLKELDDYVRDDVTYSLYSDDGQTLTDEVLKQGENIYGLGPQELSRVVQYGDFRGPVAQMLLDQRCPMSAEFELKHAPKGVEKVIDRLNLTLDLEDGDAITLSEETQEREAIKKNRQIYPTP
jgi:hypothetical protein